MALQTCRSCDNSKLIKILDLDFAPPSNALLSREDLHKPEKFYPLVLLFCEICNLVQTQDFHVDGDLFTEDYPYLSSTSSSWTKHSHELIDHLIDTFSLDGNSLVAEIASNDGYLLERLAQRNIPSYGIEPTKLAAEISLSKGHSVYNCFLNIETALQIRSERRPADIVVANNVFAHVPDLRQFTKAAKLLLSENGILIIEVQYFGRLLENSLFDTIYHEHYSYFTLNSLKYLLGDNNLGIFRVDRLDTHGGSIRVYARNNTEHYQFERMAGPYSQLEERASNLSYLLEFQSSVDEIKRNIKKFFFLQNQKGKRVGGLGAAAKGNTLLNFLKLSKDEMPYVFDSAPSKHGKFLPGSHIPIFPLGSLNEYKDINLFVVLPWNIATELSSYVYSLQKTRRPIYRLLPNIEIVPMDTKV